MEIKLKHQIKLKYLLEIFFAFILGVCFSTSYEYLHFANFSFNIFFMLRIIIFTILFSTLFIFGKKILSKKKLKSRSKFANKIINKNYSSKKQFLIFTIIIMLCWLPYLFFMYPGNLSNDTTGQLAMFFSETDQDGLYQMTDHHPVFDSVIFGSIVYVVNYFTHNMHISFFALCFIQLVMTALSFAYIFTLAHKRWKCSNKLCVILILCVSLVPIFPLIVVSVSKDTFFSWIYLLFLTFFIELVFSNFQNIKSLKIFINFIIISLLLCLTKKIGIYILLPTLIITAIFCKQQISTRLKILIPGILSVILMWGVMPSILSYFSIQPGSKIEMLSVPLQQTARTYKYYQDELLEEEKEVIDDFLDTSTLSERYNPVFADPVKGWANDKYDLNQYIKVWILEGIKYPKAYLSAWIHHVSPLFGFNYVRPIYDSLHHTWTNGYFNDEIFNKNNFFTNSSRNIKDFYLWFSSVPVLNLLVSEALYVLFIPILFILIIIKTKNKKYWLILLPIIFSLCGLFVSPIIACSFEAMRYQSPFIYTAALILLSSQKILNEK